MIVIMFTQIGKGGGPAIVSGLIVMLGRRLAFNVAVVGWLACGALLCLIYWTGESDHFILVSQR